MATTFKTFSNNDVASTRTLLHEAIPITGTIPSGTYSDSNIKNFSHGMFQSVYDYPYQSSSANHIFDLSVGYSSVVANAAYTQNTKKSNIYNMMAQVLVGHDHTGSIKRFDRDGDESTASDKMNSCVFINMARLLSKDEIKKGSFQMVLGTNTSSVTGPFDRTVKVYDHNAQTNFKTNSPAGEYGLLYATNVVSSSLGTSSFSPTHTDGLVPSDVTGEHPLPVGHIYYQAGIVVLSGSVFQASASLPNVGGLLSQSIAFLNNDGSASFQQTLTGTAITGACDMFRRRIQSVQFNNTTELNSTIYYCRANHNDFNYSSNPTYITGSKIRVKNVATDNPVAYMTTIGLYSADNELLAVAKLSEPLRKDPTNELTLRVRLDY
jgi:hypothetical protein